MATFTSLAALEAALEQEMRMAMEESKLLAKNDMDMAIQKFYAGGIPKSYKRTKQLVNTPQTIGVNGGGKHLEFEAKLNQDGGYSTGKNPSMADVLRLTEFGSFPGLQPAVGAPHYWQWAETQIIQDVISCFSNHFG